MQHELKIALYLYFFAYNGPNVWWIKMHSCLLVMQMCKKSQDFAFYGSWFSKLPCWSTLVSLNSKTCMRNACTRENSQEEKILFTCFSPQKLDVKEQLYTCEQQSKAENSNLPETKTFFLSTDDFSRVPEYLLCY